MSIVSSYFSVRSTALGINPQVASIMDSIVAIGFGLGIRFVIGAVSHHDLKVSGTLVGLWEGVVMQHFLRKMPTSFDPYVAYGVRLFVDFLFTESISRLVLVMVWTGMGVIFADIAPALWIDAGLQRIWRRFRRDLYIMSRSMPSVPYPRHRTVRFSPSQTASVISSVPPSVFTTNTQDPTVLSVPTTVPRKRHVPGAFPGEVSETETDIGSVLGLRYARSESTTAPGPARHRFTSFTRHNFEYGTDTEVSSDMNDLDDANLSSAASSVSTETPDPSAVNPSEIPDYDEEEVEEKKPEDSDREMTPRQNNVALPSPPNSFAMHDHDEPDGMLPPQEVPLMPDEDWEEISRRDASPTPPAMSKELPPLPPAEDVQLLGTSSIIPPLQQALSANDIPLTTSTHSSIYAIPTSQPQPSLIDFTNDIPASSSPQQQQQQSQLADPSHANATPPPRFSETFDNFSYAQSRSPPPQFQDIYAQGDENWNNPDAKVHDPPTGSQTNSNQVTGNNDNYENKIDRSNDNDAAAASVGAAELEGRTQSGSSTSPQTHPDAANKGKSRDTSGNGGNKGKGVRQRNKSRSGLNTPTTPSKPPSDDEGGDNPNTPNPWKKSASSTSDKVGDKERGEPSGAFDADIGDSSAPRQSDSIAGGADNGDANAGAEVQQEKSTQRTTTEATEQAAATNQAGNSHVGTDTVPLLQNPNEANGTSNDDNPAERSQQNDKVQPALSTAATSDPTTPSPSSNEKAAPAGTSSERLKQAFELRHDVITLTTTIAELEQQLKSPMKKRQEADISKQQEMLSAAMKERDELNKKINAGENTACCLLIWYHIDFVYSERQSDCLKSHS